MEILFIGLLTLYLLRIVRNSLPKTIHSCSKLISKQTLRSHEYHDGRDFIAVNIFNVLKINYSARYTESMSNKFFFFFTFRLLFKKKKSIL